MKCNLYGTPVTSLTDAVERFCIEQGNVNHNHLAATILRAGRVFHDMLKNTIWAIRTTVLDIDAATRTIQLPGDMVRLINISVVDSCGSIQPLGFDPTMNTLQINCLPKCNCKCGGVDTLCPAVDAIQVVTEQILIKDQVYYKKTWYEKCPDGKLLQYSETPYLDQATDTIEWVKENKTICSLEVNKEGCVVATKTNRDLLATHCGCFMPHVYHHVYERTSPAFRNDYGYYNFDALAKTTVHIRFSHAERVILTYQFNGEECSGEEMLIPDYAIDALQHGIIYRQKVFGNRAADGEIREADRRYTKAKDELSKFLNPIRTDKLIQLQDIIYQW